MLGSILIHSLQQFDCVRMTLPFGVLTKVDTTDDIRGGNARMHTQGHVRISDFFVLVGEFMDHVCGIHETSRLSQTSLTDLCIARLCPHAEPTFFLVVC